MYSETQFIVFAWLSAFLFLAPGIAALADIWLHEPHPTLRKWLHLKPTSSV